MKYFLARLSDLSSLIMSPLWNNAARMQYLTKWLMRGLALGIVIGLLVWLSQRPVFRLRQIQIEPVGNQTLKHINLPIVKNQILDKVQGNFFSVRLEDVKRAFEEMPWVRRAAVRRSWPNGLVIAIEEQTALGTWNTADGQKLISELGEVFNGSVAEVDDEIVLVNFSGPDGSSKEVLRLYQKANTWFKPWDVTINTLNLTERYAWSVKLSNGLRVEFGRDEENVQQNLSAERVARLLKYWPMVQAKWPTQIDAVDLRYGNGFAVHLVGNNSKRISTK
jgi:cell division protein FtsQ